MTGAPIIRAAFDADLPNIAQLQIASYNRPIGGCCPMPIWMGNLSDLEDMAPPVLDQLITLSQRHRKAARSPALSRYPRR